jgi:hypothetical protein
MGPMTSGSRGLRRLLAHGVLSASFLGLLGGASCSGAGREAGGSPPEAEHVVAPDLGRPDLRLVVLTDLKGYLEPCGCTSRPLGGIDRMAAEVSRLRGDGVPTVLVAAGDLLFDGGGDYEVHRPGAETQQIWKAETLVDILERVELAAAVPGGLDLRFGAGTFASLEARADFPMLGAGVSIAVPEAGADAGTDGVADAAADAGVVEPPTRALTLPDHVLLEVGGLRVGIVGVTDMAIAGHRDPSVTAPDDLVASAEASARALRADGADVVVALVRGPRRASRRIASQIAEIDFVVEGGLDEADAHLPAVTERGALVHAGRQGQSLVVVELHRREGGSGWTDVSAWTREAERTRLEQQAEALRARLSEWERDPQVEASDVAEQRARLADLEGQVRALRAVPDAPGHAFSARLVELAPEAARDPAVSEILAAFDRRVNLHNRDAFATWAPEPPAPGQPAYMGSVMCGVCHEEEVRWWRSTPHGRAYATLVSRNKQFNLSCVGCHVTGYNRPGGSTVARVGALQDVGCESCHGPGGMHIGSPRGAAVNVRRSTEEGTCLGCHTPEHSDTFDYATYRQRLIVPGHGLPAQGEE